MPEYKIGTTYGGLAYLTALAGTVHDQPDPRSDPMEYAEVVELGDGTRQGQGWLTQRWSFGSMSYARYNALKALVGDVYVITRKLDGTMGTFTAKLVWPEREPERWAGYYLDVELELRKLTVYTP